MGSRAVLFADGFEAPAGVGRSGVGAQAPAYEGQSPPRPEVARKDPAAGRRNRGSDGSRERTSSRRWRGRQRALGPFLLGEVPLKTPTSGGEAAARRVEPTGLEQHVVSDHHPFHAAARVRRGEPVSRPVEAVVGDRDLAAEVGSERIEADGVPSVEEEVADDADVVGRADDFDLAEPRLEPAALDRDVSNGPMRVALQDDAGRPRAEGAIADVDRRGRRAVGAGENQTCAE